MMMNVSLRVTVFIIIYAVREEMIQQTNTRATWNREIDVLLKKLREIFPATIWTDIYFTNSSWNCS